MSKPQPQDRATMGQFLRHAPRKPVWNFNTFIHSFYNPRYAFEPTATIVQQKKFPDVSFYQGTINWDLMLGMTDAVIIRAGQNNWVDTQFVRNWAEAKARGMNRGLYWFYDGRVSPTVQADLLFGLIRNDLPEMEIWIDWEHNYGGAWEGLANVVAMLQRLEVLLPGSTVGMYTGYYWFIQNSNPLTNSAQYTYLKNKPLWLAWYTNDASLVKIPPPWNGLLLWQFGTPAVGDLYGCAIPNLDMNTFNGTTAEFYTRYGAVIPPPPTGEPMRYTATATSDGTRVRPDHNVNQTYIGSYPLGTKFSGDVLFTAAVASLNQFAGDQWLQVTEINGTPKTGWVAIIHLGKPICTLVDNGTPPQTVASLYITSTITDTLIVKQPDGSQQAYTATYTVYDVEYKPNP